MLRIVLLLLSILPALAQVTKPVQVYSTSGQLQWPPTFFFTNIFAAGGTTLSFDSLGRMTISSVAGSGTNSLYQTNGVSVGSAGTVNWTTGVTGHLAAGIAHLGVSVSPSGGGASVADLLVVSNQLQTASNKFQTDVSNLQAATNSFHSTNANLANHINNVATNTIKFLTNIWGDVARGFGGLVNDQVLTYHSASQTWTNKTPTGGGGTPDGSDTDIQFNSTGSFGGTNLYRFQEPNGRVFLTGNSPYQQIYIASSTNQIGTAGMSVWSTSSDPQASIAVSSAVGGVNGGSFQVLTNRVYGHASNHMSLGSYIVPWNTNYSTYVDVGLALRIGTTNGGSGTIFADAGVWRPTNNFIFNVTNPVAGQFLKFASVTYSGPTATIILTNDTASGGGGGGTTITSGSSEVDFGAAPGSDIASIVISGQASILAGSYIRAWKAAEATADHTAFDAVVTDINISCTVPVAGTGFTIYALSRMGRLTGKYKVYWSWYN